jgi:hypothetical protein
MVSIVATDGYVLRASSTHAAFKRHKPVRFLLLPLTVMCCEHRVLHTQPSTDTSHNDDPKRSQGVGALVVVAVMPASPQEQGQPWRWPS